MTAALDGRLTRFLLRAGFVAAALAIIAGIFGMHIVSGAHHAAPGHGMTASGTVPVVHLEAMPAGHAHTTEAPTGSAGAAPAVTGSSSSCTAAGSCPEMSAGDAACVLAPGNTTLSAPLPGTAPYALPDFGAAAALGSTYSYSPDSPSPGDLCISRT